MNKKISFPSLVILMVAAIANMRELPVTALFGSATIFFFLFSALVFLLPTTIISAKLSSLFPEKGGVGEWIHQAFGKKWAMAAIWLQWINTMVWYPTVLSFIAGTLAYLINPALAENKMYLVACIVTIFWGLTLVNMKGVYISSLLNNIFCSLGTIFPLMLLIFLGVIWVLQGNPSQIQLKWQAMIPPLNQSTNWVSLIAIMASFLGMELTFVHTNEIENPQKNFPKAALIACLFIFLSMLLGSLAIATVLPNKEINFISGVMQVFDRFFSAFGMQKFTPILTLLIVLGSIGTMINWLISPAKGLLYAAEFGFLPSFFTRKNKSGVAANILLIQAIFVTFFCLVFLLQPTVNGFYWFLTALSTELYMVMYILMFCTAIKLRHLITKLKIVVFALAGLLGTSLTIIISFFPPENVNIGSPLRYFLMIAVGNAITLSPLVLFYSRYKRKKSSQVYIPE